MRVDLSIRGPEDQAFLFGMHVSEWQHAVQQIAIVILVLSQGKLDPQVRSTVFLHGDNALMQMAGYSVDGVSKPKIYLEMTSFFQQPDPLMIAEYVRQRLELGWLAPMAEMETMVQQAIAKLSKGHQ